jgi:hypothetical protein
MTGDDVGHDLAAAVPPATGEAVGAGVTVVDEAEPEPAEDGYEQQSLLPASSTGDVGIDAALADLEDLSNLPVADHVARYEAVHDVLASALNDLAG